MSFVKNKIHINPECSKNLTVSLLDIFIFYKWRSLLGFQRLFGYLRRKIGLIEINAKCSYLKKLTCKETLRQVFTVYFWGLLPSCVFVWGGLAILYVLNLVRNRVLNSCRIWSPTQLNTHPNPFPATHCLYKLHFDFGRGRRGGGGAIVHKSGSKIPTWLTVSSVY